MELIKYEAARSALAECRRVDEAKDIVDKAKALETYGRQAKDTKLIEDATEIRLRAERRCGEILIEMKEAGERASPSEGFQYQQTSNDAVTSLKPKLEDLGLTKRQSSDWQKLAKMPDAKFEKHVETAKKPPKIDPKIAKLKAQIKEVKASTKSIGNDYHMQVAKGVEERFKVLFPQLSEREAELKKAEAWLYKAIDTKTPIFTEDEFKTIRRCLHPDSRLSVSAEILARAFAMFSKKEERMVLPPKIKVSR